MSPAELIIETLETEASKLEANAAKWCQSNTELCVAWAMQDLKDAAVLRRIARRLQGDSIMRPTATPGTEK